MIRRVAMYIKEIAIEDGVVFNTIPGSKSETLIANNVQANDGWNYKLKSNYMQPKQVINVAAAGNVKISKLTEDETDNTLFDFEESFSSDRLISIRVRGFTVVPVYNLDKQCVTTGVAIVDVEF